MGVPVVTVPGQTFASRHSLSYISTIGLQELVARDEDEYVELATELANNMDKVARLRSRLRDKVAKSAICDCKKFAAEFSKIMRGIWRDWCLSQDSKNRLSSQ